MTKLTREQRSAVQDAEADLLEREAERADARRFFWSWVGVSLFVMVVGNAAVVWSEFIPTRIIGTVTVVIPPLLAFMSSIAGMVLAKVGTESALAVWGTRVLWTAAFALTYDGMRVLKRIGLGLEHGSVHASEWTTFVFPIVVDIPLAVGVACIYALRPARNADIRALKRSVADAVPLPVPSTPTVEPVREQTDKVSAKTEPKIEPKIEVVRDIEPQTIAPKIEVVREQLSATTDLDVLERAQVLVDNGRTSCDLETTAAILSALDAGEGASAISTSLGIPRGRINRVRDADRGLVAV